MKENTKRNIRGAGMFFGAAAYGFTHMPIIVAREIKKEIGAYKTVCKMMREQRERKS